MSFKCLEDYEKFANAVRTKRRYIFSGDIAEFLQAVIDTGEKRESVLKAGQPLWRAQTGCRELEREHPDGYEYLEKAPFVPERMKPPLWNPSEGRINPRGMAYLYLSTDRETSIAEMRPWRGSSVSVACFQTTRDLRLVDFTKTHGKLGGSSYILGLPEDRRKNLTAEDTEQAVWADIDNAFARPVGPNDPHVSYVPTQIIAELFRDRLFDGVVYKSSFSENGCNIALFNLDSAELKVCHLVKIKRVLYECEENSNPWYVENDEYFTHEVVNIRPVAAEGKNKL